MLRHRLMVGESSFLGHCHWGIASSWLRFGVMDTDTEWDMGEPSLNSCRVIVTYALILLWKIRIHPPNYEQIAKPDSIRFYSLGWPPVQEKGNFEFELAWIELVSDRQSCPRHTTAATPIEHLVPLRPRWVTGLVIAIINSTFDLYLIAHKKIRSKFTNMKAVI